MQTIRIEPYGGIQNVWSQLTLRRHMGSSSMNEKLPCIYIKKKKKSVVVWMTQGNGATDSELNQSHFVHVVIHD